MPFPQIHQLEKVVGTCQPQLAQRSPLRQDCVGLRGKVVKRTVPISHRKRKVASPLREEGSCPNLWKHAGQHVGKPQRRSRHRHQIDSQNLRIRCRRFSGHLNLVNADRVQVFSKTRRKGPYRLRRSRHNMSASSPDIRAWPLRDLFPRNCRHHRDRDAL